MAVDVKQAFRRLIEEAYGKGNVSVFDEICDPSFKAHDPLAGDRDLAGSKESCRMYRGAFPDLQPTILGCWADGDTVTAHWRMSGTHRAPLLGIPATGRRCTSDGISVALFRGGRLVESYVQWDALGLLRQLGASLRVEAAPEEPYLLEPEDRPYGD